MRSERGDLNYQIHLHFQKRNRISYREDMKIKGIYSKTRRSIKIKMIPLCTSIDQILSCIYKTDVANQTLLIIHHLFFFSCATLINAQPLVEFPILFHIHRNFQTFGKNNDPTKSCIIYCSWNSFNIVTYSSFLFFISEQLVQIICM